MRDARRTARAARAAAIALACTASSAFGDGMPDPALLEYLGTAARAEGSGIDVDRLVDARLANADCEKLEDEQVNDRLERGGG